MALPRIQESADVAASAKIGDGASIWHYAQVREDAVIGENVIIGRGAYVGSGVSIGANSKIQNYALVYEPAVVEAGVFIGPAVVLTNDEYPRALNPDGTQKSGHDWKPQGVTIREGSSIGAQSVCIAPVEIGAWSLVAAGSTVTKDVPAFALVAGTPAKRIGWVGRAGVPLQSEGKGNFTCPVTGARYRESASETLEEVK